MNNTNTIEYEQLSIFDLFQPTVDVPSVNEQGFIPKALLEPIKFEAWKYSNDDLTRNNGEPYVLDAFVAVLHGNRLYVKDWMLYPFMYEFKSGNDVDKAYHVARAKIVERVHFNSEKQRTWQSDELPPLVDMWLYEEGKYSAKEYAEKMLHGYNACTDEAS